MLRKKDPNDSLRCKTKYPIVLVHGLGFRDRKLFNYWGRIPKALEREGARVFYGEQEAWGTINANARIIKSRVLQVLAETGCEKVNIIAHSKGGLESRYMISKLGMENRVASLTTVSTPHHGLKSMDFVCRFLGFGLKTLSILVNQIFKLYGDKKPDFYRGCRQLSSSCCREFNRIIVNSEKVYYQSYATMMKKPYSDILFMMTHLFVKLFDGENDGLVPVYSAEWGEYKGVILSSGLRGVSHMDAVDGRRMSVGNIDMRSVYIGIVKGLKDKGF